MPLAESRTAILVMTAKFMNNPKHIVVNRDELTLEGIRQFHVAVDKEEWKLDTYCDFVECLTINQSIVYCNARCAVDWLTEALHTRGFTATTLHGGMDEK